MADPHDANNAPSAHITNFIRHIIDEDIQKNVYNGRLVTRFPPEPNGYLHIGHAKSICLNFGLARDYGGVCHLRLDDTNPSKEDDEYVQSIISTVKWLGFDWGEHLYHASDYFETLYQCAEKLIQLDKAYVEELSPDEMRAYRGTLTEPGKSSPWRDRPIEESLELFRQMRAGAFPDGAKLLRAKIDMAHPNLNMRDPAIYRIRHVAHQRTGNAWCIYPMYDYAHCVSDAIERITHSLCTLEFEDHRPLYEWFIGQLADAGMLERPLPKQREFSRLNLSYTVMSKRKLLELVQDKLVEGWDDPRMPTLVGLRRRGYTPASLRLFCERIGVSKADNWIDVSVLEECLREDLNVHARRAMAVVRPIKFIIENYPEGQTEWLEASVHPQYPERGVRRFPFGREVWIDADDFMEVPAKGFFRLSVGAEVRLRHAYLVKCTRVEKNEHGDITAIYGTYDPDTKSGTPGSDVRKVKGNLHWVEVTYAESIQVHLYDRLFSVPNPDTVEGSYRDYLNPQSFEKIQTAYIEHGHLDLATGEGVQFERLGYFCLDVPLEPRVEQRRVFNRSVSLKDTAKQKN
ncbi:MAG: glutamine--tRNA ligase/YqeY domain fusion protein [Pseudomonadota bacterium]